MRRFYLKLHFLKELIISQENFFRFAKENDIKLVGISPQAVFLRDETSATAVHEYSFLAAQKYAFCVFPHGLSAETAGECHDLLYVSYPAGPEISDLVLFDASVSICLQQYRMATADTVHQTVIVKDKFAHGEQQHREGLICMDSTASMSLEETCVGEEEFGLFCFAGEEDES